jgi:two-component system, OmpR family, response regulator MprA
MCVVARTASIFSCNVYSWRVDTGSCAQTERTRRRLVNREPDTSLAVLIVEDVAETRDGIEKLLKADGYRVAVARDELDAIESAQLKHPDLILVSLAGLPRDVIVSARRIRERAEVGENVPVVVFCNDEIGEGDEVAIGKNVHITRPDNFNQLRSLLTRLLHKIPIAA